MDLVESIGWIVAGFVPTLVSLQVGYIISTGKSKKGAQPKISQASA